MACLGVHFSLSEVTVEKLKSFSSEETRLEYLQEELEEDYFANHPECLIETDKAWDAIHRTLTDGELGWENGTSPLNQVILGGEVLYTNDDYIMSLKTPAEVSEIAVALKTITEEQFRENYFNTIPASFGLPVSEEDFEYTLDNFQQLCEFYSRAADQKRYVLFSADQ